MTHDQTPAFDFDLRAPRRRISKTRVLWELRRYARAETGRLTARGYTQSRPGVSLASVNNLFGSFRAACEAAGLDTSGIRRVYSDEDVVAGFEDVCRDRHRRGFTGAPVCSDFERHARSQGAGVSIETLTKRFGPYGQFLREYDKYHRGAFDRLELIARCKRRGRKGAARPAPRGVVIRLVWPAAAAEPLEDAS